MERRTIQRMERGYKKHPKKVEKFNTTDDSFTFEFNDKN